MKDFPKEEAEEEVKYKKTSLNPKRGKRPLFKNKEKTFRRPKEWEVPSHHFCSGHKPAAMEMQKKETKLKEEKRERGPKLTEPPPRTTK